MSNAGAAVVAGAAAAVATRGNSRDRQNAGDVAAVACVAAAGVVERVGAAEPFAWLWARRREGKKVDEVEARAAYLLRFAQEAFSALATREPDPVEAEVLGAILDGADDGEEGGP